VREAGVAAIPLSAFLQSGKPDHFIRFAFCKRHELLAEVLTRLGRYFA